MNGEHIDLAQFEANLREGMAKTAADMPPAMANLPHIKALLRGGEVSIQLGLWMATESNLLTTEEVVLRAMASVMANAISNAAQMMDMPPVDLAQWFGREIERVARTMPDDRPSVEVPAEKAGHG